MTREIYRLLCRLARLEKRLDATHGETINIPWLHWMGVYGETFNELRRVAPELAMWMAGQP